MGNAWKNSKLFARAELLEEGSSQQWVLVAWCANPDPPRKPLRKALGLMCQVRWSQYHQVERGQAFDVLIGGNPAKTLYLDSTNILVACQFELNRNRRVYEHKATGEDWFLFADFSLRCCGKFPTSRQNVKVASR